MTRGFVYNSNTNGFGKNDSQDVISSKSGDKTMFSVKSTVTLRNDLKIIRTFNIDYSKYQILRNDEDRR